MLNSVYSRKARRPTSIEQSQQHGNNRHVQTGGKAFECQDCAISKRSHDSKKNKSIAHLFISWISPAFFILSHLIHCFSTINTTGPCIVVNTQRKFLLANISKIFTCLRISLLPHESCLLCFYLLYSILHFSMYLIIPVSYSHFK